MVGLEIGPTELCCVPVIWRRQILKVEDLQKYDCMCAKLQTDSYLSMYTMCKIMFNKVFAFL